VIGATPNSCGPAEKTAAPFKERPCTAEGLGQESRSCVHAHTLLVLWLGNRKGGSRCVESPLSGSFA
jgi:hypothetical protein